ncbi:MAG: hypothetical protein EBQ92_00255 [Proteobacteria bacterium]|nr:hypothetical protein [Pseudomonadota bacterium]
MTATMFSVHCDPNQRCGYTGHPANGKSSELRLNVDTHQNVSEWIDSNYGNKESVDGINLSVLCDKLNKDGNLTAIDKLYIIFKLAPYTKFHLYGELENAIIVNVDRNITGNPWSPNGEHHIIREKKKSHPSNENWREVFCVRHYVPYDETRPQTIVFLISASEETEITTVSIENSIYPMFNGIHKMPTRSFTGSDVNSEGNRHAEIGFCFDIDQHGKIIGGLAARVCSLGNVGGEGEEGNLVL